jgi:hypothetical protein
MTGRTRSVVSSPELPLVPISYDTAGTSPDAGSGRLSLWWRERGWRNLPRRRLRFPLDPVFFEAGGRRLHGRNLNGVLGSNWNPAP